MSDMIQIYASPETARRERRLTRRLTAASLALCIVAVLQLPPICIRLLPVAAVPFIIYPFMKRVTFCCHGVLGIAIAMAPAGGWVAVRASIGAPMIMLCVAVGLWIGACDAVYGAQDETFDRAHGLHSLATKLGVPLALEMARVFHIACIVCFVLTGFMVRATWPYYLGVLIAAVTLVYQHLIIAPYDFSSLTQAYFMRNGVVSVAMFLCTWLSYCVG